MHKQDHISGKKVPYQAFDKFLQKNAAGDWQTHFNGSQLCLVSVSKGICVPLEAVSEKYSENAEEVLK